MAIVTYNDNGTIKVVKFGTYVVSTDADPVVQKQWVFLEGSIKPNLWEKFEQVGLVEGGYESQGCASPDLLRTSLDAQYPASELSPGTKAAIKMNEASAGGQTCNSWAIFEVQEVIENYVRFVSAEARTITPKYTNSGVTLQYSIDRGSTWTTIEASGYPTTSAKEHWFRGQATGTKSLFISSADTNAWVFMGSSNLKVYGNLNYLLCNTLGDEEAPTSLEAYAYAQMFRGCTSLQVAPELPATTLESSCYANMFRDCGRLTTAPQLPATTLAESCYESMFRSCIAFKVSETQTGSYTYAWRIPTSGTGITATDWNKYMLTSTGGTYTGSPDINKTYYVENKPV